MEAMRGHLLCLVSILCHCRNALRHQKTLRFLVSGAFTDKIMLIIIAVSFCHILPVDPITHCTLDLNIACVIVLLAVTDQMVKEINCSFTGVCVCVCVCVSSAVPHLFSPPRYITRISSFLHPACYCLLTLASHNPFLEMNAQPLIATSGMRFWQLGL